MAMRCQSSLFFAAVFVYEGAGAGVVDWEENGIGLALVPGIPVFR